MANASELVRHRHVLDKSHIKLTYVTHFYCNQQSIDSVISLLRKYETYPATLLDQIEFVIVDDGSPLEYIVPELNLNYRWLKITTDIPWNQGGARNLGVTWAKSDKILMSDLDHGFPAETLHYMVNAPNPGRKFYKLRRRTQAGEIYKGHSNIFFMSRARFMRFWGYDEEYSGGHGGEDYRFVKFHKYHGSQQRYFPASVWCYERELDREKSYHTLSRDQVRNMPIDERKRDECATFGAEYGHSRIFLNFEWKMLAQHTRRSTDTPPVNRAWRRLWWFRWLWSAAAK